MYIMLKDYYNGEKYPDAYSYCDEVITEKVAAENHYRVKIFSSPEEARKYAIQKYHDDVNNIITNTNSVNSTILEDDGNIFAYISPVDERVAYKWVDLNDPNMII